MLACEVKCNLSVFPTVRPVRKVLVMTAVMFEMSPTGWHTIMELSMKASMERLV